MSKKAVHAMLVKLTTSFNFTNVLLAAFMSADPKDTDDLTALLAVLGSVLVKAAHKMLVKLTKGVIFINILHVPFSIKSALCRFSLITV